MIIVKVINRIFKKRIKFKVQHLQFNVKPSHMLKPGERVGLGLQSYPFTIKLANLVVDKETKPSPKFGLFNFVINQVKRFFKEYSW